MGWFVALVLMLFYALGLFVFHGTRAVHVLPMLAAAVVILDQFLVRRYRER